MRILPRRLTVVLDERPDGERHQLSDTAQCAGVTHARAGCRRCPPFCATVSVDSWCLSVLWLLARQPEVSTELLTRFKDEATALGYDMNNMIFDVQRKELPR